MTIVELLVALVLVVLLVWAAKTVLPLLGLPQPIVTVLYVVIVVLVVIWLVRRLGVLVI